MQLSPAAAPEASQQSPKYGYQVRLFNVHPELGAQDLAEAFASVSQNRVESVDVLRDVRGLPTGEAILIFNQAADAENAVNRYHGGDLNGQRLQVIFEGQVVQEATPRSSS